MNGPGMERYAITRADWFSLLLQGEFRTATANSDSHKLGTPVALPLNYVRLDGEGDTPATFDEAAFVDAVRRGRSFGTTGPLLFARLGEAGPGDLHRGANATLVVRVRAAPWVPVDRGRVYVNAELTGEFEAGDGQTIELPLRFDADAFVTVEVEGDADEDLRPPSPRASRRSRSPTRSSSTPTATGCGRRAACPSPFPRPS